MAALHEELEQSVTLQSDEDFLDTVEGFRKDVKNKISKFLCGGSDQQAKKSGSTKRDPSPSTSSTSSTDFARGQTAYVAREAELASGESESDIYNFDHQRRGLAVIINNEKFSGSSDFDDRPGSSYDASSLYHSFAHLGFDVLLYRDLAAWKMVEVLRDAARDYDHLNADCFVCSVLTHGDQTWSEREYDRLGVTVRQDLLFGTDGKAVSTRTVIDLFSDQASPGLKGKPRLFFLQACRGNRLDDGQDIHVITPVPRGITRRGNRDAPDATDRGAGNGASAGATEGRHLKAGSSTQGGQTEASSVAPGLAKRQTSLSSSVDPPGYPRGTADRVDASQAPDEEEGDKGQGFPAGSHHVDAGGDEGQHVSSVDQGRMPWSRVRDVPVSPAPLYKDCLVMYATPPGHFAWRRKNGAWFIQSLCKVLDSRYLSSLSLARALVQVSGYVARNYQSENPSRPNMHAKKEMPVIESMLVKDIFLTHKRRT